MPAGGSPNHDSAAAVTSADIGRRVTVRYRLAEPEPQASATDVVGVLVDMTEGHLVVKRRTGEKVRVPSGAVIVARAIPESTQR